MMLPINKDSKIQRFLDLNNCIFKTILIKVFTCTPYIELIFTSRLDNTPWFLEAHFGNQTTGLENYRTIETIEPIAYNCKCLLTVMDRVDILAQSLLFLQSKHLKEKCINVHLKILLDM